MSINIDHLIMNADDSVLLIVHPITKNECGRKLLSLKGTSNKYHFEAAVDAEGEGQWGVQRKGQKSGCCPTLLGSVTSSFSPVTSSPFLQGTIKVPLRVAACCRVLFITTVCLALTISPELR